MTNFEKHKERLLKIVDSMDEGIAVCNGVPYSCEDAQCDDCDFYCGGGSCEAKFIRWLYQEYEEIPKLSERAYHFLKSLPEGAKIEHSEGRLYMHIGHNIVNTSRCSEFVPEIPLQQDVWYEVSEILKWEVEK